MRGKVIKKAICRPITSFQSVSVKESHLFAFHGLYLEERIEV